MDAASPTARPTVGCEKAEWPYAKRLVLLLVVFYLGAFLPAVSWPVVPLDWPHPTHYPTLPAAVTAVLIGTFMTLWILPYLAWKMGMSTHRDRYSLCVFVTALIGYEVQYRILAFLYPLAWAC